MTIVSKQKGFTLIELMIVVAIIGILASIAIPQFASFRVKAFDAAGSADLKNGTTAIEAVYTEDYAYPTTSAGSVTDSSFFWTSDITWASSKGVTIGHKGDTAKYALGSKHVGGKKIYSKTRVGQHTESAGTEGTAMVIGDVPTAL